MSKYRGRLIDGKWVWTDLSKVDNSSKPVGIMVKGDNIDPTIHHGSGKIFDSRSKFEAETKRLGLARAGESYQPKRPTEWGNKEAILKEWNKQEWKN